MRGRLLAGVVTVALVGGVTVAVAQDASPSLSDCVSVAGDVVGVEGDELVLEVRVSCPAPAATSTTSTTVPASSSTSTSTTSPTTTAAPTTTTTTVPPSTTTSSTTTTTEAPSTTLPPDSGSTFTATFDTAGDFFDQFDFHVSNYCEAGTWCRPEEAPWWFFQKTEWVGDHDHTADGACTDPYQSRIVDPDPHSDMVYWCAPGGPATGHVMTALNHSGYAIIGFSPKRSFLDVNRVCVDVNRTDLGGGKWINLAVVPEATFVSHPNENPARLEDGEGSYRMDYPVPSLMAAAPFQLGSGGATPEDFAGVYMVRFFRGFTEAFEGTDRVFVADEWRARTAEGDKATRFEHCIVENPDGTITISQERADGETTVYTHPGRFPDGKARVVFIDDSYNPDKHGGIDAEEWEPRLPEPRYTWHWDNVTIDVD